MIALKKNKQQNRQLCCQTFLLPPGEMTNQESWPKYRPEKPQVSCTQGWIIV